MSIVVRDLGFSYFDRTVIGGADAEFRSGLIHLLLGATGSGKTTFALLLAGLLKPKRGSVAVDGCDPASDKFERSRLQLAFQFPEAQIFESVVEREIEYGLRNFGFSPEEASARRDWAADCVGLSRRLLSKDPAEISFGERRKTALASAIALKPAYLILDEPLAGLDWQGRASLVATLLRLKAEGLTTLVLTHEADLIAELGDAVSLLASGVVTGPMTPEEFLNPDETGQLPGRGGRELVPEFARTLLSLKSLGYPVGKVPRQVGEVAEAAIRALSGERIPPGERAAAGPGET
jgi:energy-coupling factor transport system ATP-binding protein